MHSGAGNYRRVSGLPGDRVLTDGDLVWLDGLTLVAGTLALYGLYAAANQLMANRPRLMNLRG